MRLRILCLITVLSVFLRIIPYAQAEVYKSAAITDKKIALTFDDGPHYKYTAQILDILKKYGIKATFFVIGVNAEKLPSQVKRAHDEGHEIGNHTYSHPHLKNISVAQLESQIEKSSEVIEKITGSRPTLFRPPEGYCENSVAATAEKMGYTVILWSQDTMDWAHNTPQKISKDILCSIKCGDIILFHDFITPDTPTPQALERIIPELLKMGYEFVTVSELLGA